MAKSDKIISLVRAGAMGDKVQFKRVVESLIADERQKRHHVIAERLEQELVRLSTSNSNVEAPIAKDNRVSSLVDEISPKLRFEDLILTDSVKDSLHELVEEQSRVDLLRSYSLEPRNRVLLIGPPGNGKTSLAEALAESMMVPLLVVRYEGIIGSYLGETASRLKKVIDYASTRRCVLLFDEFETLGKERGDTHETGEIKRVVSSLLMQIDSLPSHVIVMAATNHAELLDRAVWRRFQLRLEVPQPTKSQIEAWFIAFEKRHNVSLDYGYDTLSKRLYGSNFAEIEEFGRVILRKYVLTIPSANMRNIISSTLKTWSERTLSSS
ncbi:ATP-binding protein [Vibrio parahaemolyticus]|uniref:AAA family ATPase n=1 Tax=Vibrio parahaemolyticus TaxID=670 RepID=UPI0003DBE734|nr:AAA family ATPase [Vibrio parahaemolyticus]EGQ7868625.1 ATP-binding protein [Vibrio parahaemolyticus]EGQ7885106.1 ATP-binding protein [Vibrio parahaemolyticus]EGQ9373245.1 ATP-binding protein [Vibrio parahaemolyticus]EGQ9422961.1 ATP-binding protein [Vibrio parahaemolyticus]EGQ9428034.1 ATP-binding protein [Vibrio parahaemolyticus]